MSRFNEIRQNDIGTIFRITLKDNGVIADVSSATVKQIKLQDEDGVTITRTANFYSDGTDGIVQYTTIDGDLDSTGMWKIQVYIEMPDWIGHSSHSNFRVRSNL